MEASGSCLRYGLGVTLHRRRLQPQLRRRESLLLVYGATSRLLSTRFPPVPAPRSPPLLHNYVCADPPAVGLVNRAHLASCRRSGDGAGPARGLTVCSPFLTAATERPLFVLQTGQSKPERKLDIKDTAAGTHGTEQAHTCEHSCRHTQGTQAQSKHVCEHSCTHTHGHTWAQRKHTHVSTQLYTHRGTQAQRKHAHVSTQLQTHMGTHDYRASTRV